MHDFGNLIYLDLHKSGSSYVSKFLKECCILKEKKFIKHDWIRGDYNKNSFYFITIRHPIELYSSLYRYGLNGLGDVRNRIAYFQKLHAYDSFNSFLNFCLNENNANYLGFGYSKLYSSRIGFMSFRFMKLSLQFPHKKLDKAIKEKKNILELKQEFITNLEIKNESLNSELLNLSTKIIPNYFNQDKAKHFLATSKKINVSKKKTDNLESISKENLAILKVKEALLFEKYI